MLVSDSVELTQKQYFSTFIYHNLLFFISIYNFLEKIF